MTVTRSYQDKSMDWNAAVQRVIAQTQKGKVKQRLDFLDYLVLHAPLHLSDVDAKCRELSNRPAELPIGAIRDNAYINPVTKIIHGRQEEAQGMTGYHLMSWTASTN